MLSREFDLKRKTILDNIHTQRLIYLLQRTGVKLRYDFSWTYYGPDSSELFFDAYEVLDSKSSEYAYRTKDLKFDSSSQKKLSDFRNLLGDKLNNTQFLDLFASLDFICKTWFPDTDVNNILPLMKKYKPSYFDGELIEDTDIIQAFNLRKVFCGRMVKK